QCTPTERCSSPSPLNGGSSLWVDGALCRVPSKGDSVPSALRGVCRYLRISIAVASSGRRTHPLQSEDAVDPTWSYDPSPIGNARELAQGGMQPAHGPQSRKRGPMSGIGSIRRSPLVRGVVAALLVPTVATASHGGGGGGGGAQPPPPPSGTPAVTFTPTSL